MFNCGIMDVILYNELKCEACTAEEKAYEPKNWLMR